MAKTALPSLQASDAFAITPSNTLDIVDDPANSTNLYRFCYVHVAGTGGLVKVDTCGGGTVSMYCAQGAVLGGNLPIQVKRVYSTGTAATSLVALIGFGGTF